MPSPDDSPAALANVIADVIEASNSKTVEPLKYIAKSLAAICGMQKDDDEVRAWDRFAANAILRAPEGVTPEELVAYVRDLTGTMMTLRRELFEGEGAKAAPSAPEGSRTLKLIEAAQEMENRFVESNGTRFDLFERAKALRVRADLALGIATPAPKVDSPDERNAAAERRIQQALNGASAPLNGSPPLASDALDEIETTN